MKERYAILGDVHGNWAALDAVLKDAAGRDVTRYACVGDVVGYNADPSECLDRLRAAGAAIVQGNHDYFSSNDDATDEMSEAAAAAIEWTRLNLSTEQADYLARLPRTMDVDGFSLVHNTLDNRFDPWRYAVNVQDARDHFAHQHSPVCFHGHTHVPVLFEMRRDVTISDYGKLVLRPDSLYFVNVGSVGQPRDWDPRAAYAIYTPARHELELLRVAYDIAQTQKRAERAGLPEWLSSRLSYGM